MKHYKLKQLIFSLIFAAQPLGIVANELIAIEAMENPSNPLILLSTSLGDIYIEFVSQPMSLDTLGFLNDIENDWVDRSEKRGLAPYMARCIYWDRNQNRKNSRYWSKVLEK